MKVGYIAPASIAIVNGGVRTQAMFTIKHISRFGVEPVMISPWKDAEVESFDLVHIFGASIENMGIADQFFKQEIPVMISPVFYSNRSAGTIRTAIRFGNLLSRITPGFRSDFNIKAEMCRNADRVLPNTRSEASLIAEGFSVEEKSISVIPNGVEKRFGDANADLFTETYGLKDFVLFAGQAGAPRKNVFKLLEAISKTELPLVIIGQFGNDRYGRQCKELADTLDQVHLIDPLPHEANMLASAYAACKVFVLPSRFETPGIAAMEAALAGANIAITQKGGTTDYFKHLVDYLDPEKVDSIRNAITEAFRSPKNNNLKQHILQHYTWEEVARSTANEYKKLLS